jgi:hypothetical protein
LAVFTAAVFAAGFFAAPVAALTLVAPSVRAAAIIALAVLAAFDLAPLGSSGIRVFFAGTFLAKRAYFFANIGGHLRGCTLWRGRRRELASLLGYSFGEQAHLRDQLRGRSNSSAQRGYQSEKLVDARLTLVVAESVHPVKRRTDVRERNAVDRMSDG